MKFLLIAVLGAASAMGAMPPTCHMNRAPVVAKAPASGIFAKMALALTNPTAFLAASVEPQRAGGPSCPHNQEVERWRGWRRRNPSARSRYDDAPPGLRIERNLSAERLSFSAEDPEPDPAGFGCGCDLEFALSAQGCGWWHSQVWAVKK